MNLIQPQLNQPDGPFFSFTSFIHKPPTFQFIENMRTIKYIYVFQFSFFHIHIAINKSVVYNIHVKSLFLLLFHYSIVKTLNQQ